MISDELFGESKKILKKGGCQGTGFLGIYYEKVI